MRKLLFFILLLSSLASAQSWLNVTAANIHGGSNALLPAGNLTFTATDVTGAPISYQAGGGGQVVSFPITCPIVNGALSGPQCLVANLSVSNPENFCYSVTITNSSNQLVLGGPQSGYQCVQPQTSNSWCAAGTCNFDQYVPNLPAAITAMMPPPTTLSLGGVYAASCGSSLVQLGIDNTGRPVCGSVVGTGNVVGSGLTLNAPLLGAGGSNIKIDAANVIALTGADINTSNNVVGLQGKVLPSPVAGYLNYTGSAWALTNPFASPTFTGTVTLPVTGASIQCLHVSTSGVLSGTGADCGAGGGSSAFQVNSTPVTSSSTINFANSALFNGLTLTFSNPSLGVVQLGASGQLTNAGLATPSMTINGQGCTLGVGCNVPFQTNSTNNASLTGLNFLTSSANTVGLVVTPVNSGNQEKFEVSGGSYTGNAATATALAANPSLCPTGQAPTGVLATGAATGCAPLGGAGTITSVNPTFGITGGGSSGAVPLSLTPAVVAQANPAGVYLWSPPTGNVLSSTTTKMTITSATVTGTNLATFLVNNASLPSATSVMNGLSVTVSGFTSGSAFLNGVYTLAYVDATHFTVSGSGWTNATYSSGTPIAVAQTGVLQVPAWTSGVTYYQTNWAQNGPSFYRASGTGMTPNGCAYGTALLACAVAVAPAPSCTGTPGSTTCAPSADGIVWTYEGPTSSPSNAGQMSIDDMNIYLLTSPFVSGISRVIYQGCTQGGCPNSFDSGTTAPSYNFATSVNPDISGWIAQPQFTARQKMELVLSHTLGSTGASSGGLNTATPLYVPSQAYANSIQNPWTPSQVYLPWQYICDAGLNQCHGAGHFQFITTAGSCTANTSAPSWNHSGSTTTDGSCTWQDAGTTNAPPQHFIGGACSWGNSTLTGLTTGGIYSVNAAYSTGGAAQAASDLVTGFPIPWEVPYLTSWEGSTAALVANFNTAAYVARIAALRVGLGSGAENFGWCNAGLITAAGGGNVGTSANYRTAWEGMLSAYEAPFIAGLQKSSAFYIGTSPNGQQGNAQNAAVALNMAQTIAANGIGFGNEGASTNDFGGGNYPNLANNNGINTAATVRNSVPFLQMETAGISDPTGVNASFSTGPLLPLLQFYAGKYTMFDPFIQDAYLALDPHWSSNAAYGASYKAGLGVFSAAALGGGQTGLLTDSVYGNVVGQLVPVLNQVNGFCWQGGATGTGLLLAPCGAAADTNVSFTLGPLGTGRDILSHETLSDLAGSGVQCLHIDNSGNVTGAGSDCGTIGGNISGNSLNLSGPLSGNSWSINGIGLTTTAATYTDTTGSGTIVTEAANALGAPTITTTNLGVTVTNLVNLFLASPVAGTNVTATNTFALYTLGSIGGSHVDATTFGGLSTTADAALCAGTCTTGGAAAPDLTLQASDTSATGGTATGGLTLVRGGGLTTATPNAAAVEGNLEAGDLYLLGTVANQWDLVCGTTTAYTVSDCGTSNTNFVGVASSTANPIGVVNYGRVPVKLDGALTALGDNVCLSGTTAGAGHDNGSATTACATGTGVGVIVADSGTVHVMTGATKGTQALSTTIVLVQLRR